MKIGAQSGFAVRPQQFPQFLEAPVGERLDGWKSIAAYFRRDRTTVIRWARERGLPVHRLPGGRTGTVFALTQELQDWAGLVGAQDAATETVDIGPEAKVIVTGAPLTARSKPRRLELTAGIILSLMVSSATPSTVNLQSAPLVGQPIPTTIANRFLAARDLVAERDAVGIERGIALLEDVIRTAPGYAPAHAALAEALLLSREFGVRDDAEAFARARTAARTAVRLAPGFATSDRLLGFIAYWADGDFAQAKAHFRKSLALDPNDTLAHFWYGNILSDHGDHAAGLRALDRARLMQPGSVAIRTDLAWARWAAGDAAGVDELRQIVQRHPDFAVAHECLAIIALTSGDAAGYVGHFEIYARLRRDPRLIAHAAYLRRAADGPRETLLRTILDRAVEDVSQGRLRDHIWAATVASLTGERTIMVDLLNVADRRREKWGEAGLVGLMRKRWSGDPGIQALISRRTPP